MKYSRKGKELQPTHPNVNFEVSQVPLASQARHWGTWLPPCWYWGWNCTRFILQACIGVLKHEFRCTWSWVSEVLHFFRKTSSRGHDHAGYILYYICSLLKCTQQLTWHTLITQPTLKARFTRQRFPLVHLHVLQCSVEMKCITVQNPFTAPLGCFNYLKNAKTSNMLANDFDDVLRCTDKPQ